MLVLPDVIANAGGVTVSYFEWVQDFSSFFWTEDEINARLVRIMKEAFAGGVAGGAGNHVSLRTATLHRSLPAHPARPRNARTVTPLRLWRLFCAPRGA